MLKYEVMNEFFGQGFPEASNPGYQKKTPGHKKSTSPNELTKPLPCAKSLELVGRPARGHDRLEGLTGGATHGRGLSGGSPPDD